MFKTLAFLALLKAYVLGQFLPAPTDLVTKEGYAGVSIRYKEVPTGICELDPNVKSYSGYADVASGRHIFFWFFEARNVDPSIAPLTVWINGGPGSSSMIGLFQELGPCRVDANYTAYNNPYSWSNASNLLFIDQPSTVGFSYSEPVSAYLDTNTDLVVTLPSPVCPDYAEVFGTCGTYSYANESLVPNNTKDAAPNFWQTLQGFMGVFPQYSRENFTFTTESYGGHYGPVFNEYFEMQNARNIPGAQRINLKTVMIGNGWYDPLIQYQAYYNYTVNPGNPYDYFPFNSTIEAQMYNALYGRGNCVDQIKYCAASGIDEICSSADNFCASGVEEVLDIYANRDEYDIRELMPDSFPYNFYVQYLNRPDIQKALGAFTNFSDSSSIVGSAFGSTGDDNREDCTIEDVQLLLRQGVQVIMYAGDADYNCNYLGGQIVADEVNAPGYASAGYTNITTSDSVVHGQVRQSGGFAFVRIYESGHEVPFYQPLVALEMFERALQHRDIATGRQYVTPWYRTVGTPRSLFREGNSTVQFGLVDVLQTYNTTSNTPNESLNATST